MKMDIDPSPNSLTHVLAKFDATRCDFIGRVMHPLEPDQSIERAHFLGWYNWLYPAPSRMTRGGAGLQVIVDQGMSVLEWPEMVPCLLINGDSTWVDYQVDTEVRAVMHDCWFYNHDETTFNLRGLTGIAFRVQDSRRHYIAGFEHGNRLIIGARENANLIVLNSIAFDVDLDHYYRLSVRCAGERIELFVDGKLAMVVNDGRWKSGGAGVYTNTVTRWRRTSISCSDEEFEARNTRLQALETSTHAAQSETPQPVTQLELQLPEDGCRFKGMIREAKLMLLSAGNKALLAIGMDGTERWRFTPNADEAIAGAASSEIEKGKGSKVIALTGKRLVLLDGKSGAIEAETPYPAGSPFFHMRGEKAKLNANKINCFYTAGHDKPARLYLFEDTGAGTHTLWSYDERLNLRWTHHQHVGKSGHALHAYDINGDGRDELTAGYYALDDDGKYIWQVPNVDRIYKQDHVDNWYVGPMGKDGKLRMVCACGEAGIVILDATNGQTVAQLRGLGHMQRVAAGRFVPGRSDKFVWIWTDWGSPGIFYLVDGEGNLLHRFQPDPRCTAAQAVRWTADGPDLLLMHTSFGGAAPGLYDSKGRRVVDLGSSSRVDEILAASVLSEEADQVVVIQGRTLKVLASGK